MRQKLSTKEAGKLGGIKAAKTLVSKKQKRIKDWNLNPKLCLQCQLPLSYDKRRNNFCGQSCGATYNNALRSNCTIEVLEKCLNCSKPLLDKGQHKYCSKQCMTGFWWNKTKEELVSIGIDKSSANNIGKKYLIELHQGKCQICNFSEWQSKPIPLVLDHINGNPYDNLLSNLRVICHNCNAQTSTFAGRNKGNGRFERAKRYKLEKEIMNDIKADVVQ